MLTSWSLLFQDSLASPRSDPTLAKCGLKKDVPFFLSINRFERKKNLNLALHAFAHLKKNSRSIFFFVSFLAALTQSILRF